MHQPIQFQTTVQNSISRWLPLRRSLVLIPLVLACFGFSPAMQAVSPPPDGGYTGANTAEGTQALQSLTTGLDNTAIGYQALFSTTTGSFNTAAGYLALRSNTTGTRNTAIGYQALYLNTTGSFSVGIGLNTLFHNTTGSFNSANGYYALYNNTTGSSNVANGLNALYANTSGSNNTANGFKALFSNIDGEGNNAIGYQALLSNTSGGGNVAIGYQALLSSTTSGFPPNDGTSNAIGYQALQNSNGFDNNAVGFQALQMNVSGAYNNAFGWEALLNCTGTSNTAIGDGAGRNATTGSGNVYIGAGVTGVAGESNQTYIRNIGNTFQDTGIYVTLDSVGGTKLGYVNLSSRRYKDNIKPMDKASEVLYTLKPVTFRFKKEYDPAHGPGYGLIAEEVDKINPDLVSHNDKGEVMTVRYDYVYAMVLNEFLKEHKKVEEQQASIAELKSTVALQQKEMQVLTAQLKEQAAQIQKVSTRLAAVSPSRNGLETSKPARQLVANR